MTANFSQTQPSAQSVLAAVAVLQAAAQQHRLGILVALRHGPAHPAELCATLGITRSSLAHHMRLLRMAELITQRRTGQTIQYLLADASVATLVDAALSVSRGREHLSHVVRL